MILSCNIVNRAGITPTYGDFSYISDNTYSAKEISDEVERVKDVIGSSFDHRLTLYDAIVKIFTDLPHWMSDVKTSLLDQDSLRVVVEAQKNAELAIMHVDTYRYPIARVAVACVVHARQQFNRTSWNEDLERCTGFTWSEVLPAVRHIRRIRGNRTNLVAVEIKYRDAYIHMCRYRRSQLLYVVPRPAYHPTNQPTNDRMMVTKLLHDGWIFVRSRLQSRVFPYHYTIFRNSVIMSSVTIESTKQ